MDKRRSDAISGIIIAVALGAFLAELLLYLQQ